MQAESRVSAKALRQQGAWTFSREKASEPVGAGGRVAGSTPGGLPETGRETGL